MKKLHRILLTMCLMGSFLVAGCQGQEQKKSEESSMQEESWETQTEESSTLQTKETLQDFAVSLEESGSLLEEMEEEDPDEGMDVPSVCGALQVRGTVLTDQRGRPVRLRGISTHGLSWFPDYVNEDCFRQLRQEWKVNVIRLAMYTAESGGYCTDGNKEELKALIRQGVEYAVNQDMYVIIDWHILSDGNPNQHLEEAREFFREMSETYKDCDNVLYEICNEPNGNTEWSDIKSYAKEIIGIIREKDPDGIILVGTPNWSQMVDEAAADPVTGYENVMYTLHFYAATHTDWLRDKMKQAIDSGLPVFVSEYGICDASGNGSIDEAQADAWVQLMEEYGVSYVAWNLSNKAETSAILKENCKKISGFGPEDLSDSGRWLYEILTGNGSEPDKQASGGGEMVTGKPSGEEDLTGSAVRGEEESLIWQAELKNSWEAEGRIFCQYGLTVTNDSEEGLDGWTVALTFQEDIELSDGWNGVYETSGRVLSVSALDYNQKIPAGGRVSDVGFIVSGEKGPFLAEE